MSQQFFAQRRAAFCQHFDDNAVIILVGNKAKSRSKNINYHFRPDNDFYYLTGFSEQNSIAIIRPGHNQPYILFTRASNVAAEINFGARAGLQGAKEYFLADQAYDIAQADQQIPELLEQRTKVYYLDEQGFYHQQIFNWLDSQRKNSAFDVIKNYRQLLPLAPLLHQLRLIKSPDEIALIKHAVNASVSGHKKVMQACQVGMNEMQLAATFDLEIANFGCSDVAYPSIVASGNNACCLHYEDNNSPLTNGELLLIDAGAEYQFYCSDITRTWPINGKFSSAQTALYQLVLTAIDSAIAKVKPGLSWHEIHQTCMDVMAQGLIDLGILTGTFEQVMADESYKQFTIHKTGHWLGMDVHDVGCYLDDNGQWLKLVANMVFTIEPGIYIPKHCQSVAEKWRGIGIRIEDDILVTENGGENLSAQAPRTIAEIESWMKLSC